jgi:lysophospholipase L1-like esterase
MSDFFSTVKQFLPFRLFLVIIGFLFGFAIYTSLLLQSSSQLPEGWQREPLQIPYKLAAHLGKNNPQGGWITLDYYRGIYPPKRDVQSLSLDFILPEDGQIELWLRAAERPRSSDCERNLHSKECRKQFYDSTGVIFEQIGEAGTKIIRGKGKGTAICQMKNQQKVPVPRLGKNTVSINYSGSQIIIELNQEQKIYCNAVLSSQAPLIRPGIRSIQISNLKLDASRQYIQSPPPSFLFLFIGGLGGFLLSFLYTSRLQVVRVGYCILEVSPLLLIVPLLLIDHRQWIETLRAPWLPWLWLPTLIPITTYLFVVFSRYTYQQTKKTLYRSVPLWLFSIPLCVLFFPPIRSYSESLLCGFLSVSIPIAWHFVLKKILERTPTLVTPFWGILGLFFAFLTESQHIWSAMWCSLLFVFWGMWIQIQVFAQKIPLYNIWSLGTVVMIFVGLEGYIRGTYAGRMWSNQGSRTEMNDMFGWVDKANKGFALLEEKEHKVYPDEGYPISFQQKTNRLRIVAFGGSSTGGAYQNDDIKDFYPQKISDVLNNSTEVLNQGVGGWTTWHIKEYILDRSEDLRPDIATFYIGHNDILTSVPLPYKQLYAAWKQNSGRNVSSFLGDFRLYHALRHVIISARPAQTRAAVPVSHAKENFKIIQKSLEKYDTSIVLASEGLAPDPGPMKAYNDMMQSLAVENKNIYFVDIAEKLHRYPSSQVYLDDCHLTEYGHKLVAQWFVDIFEEIPNWDHPASKYNKHDQKREE